MATASDPMPPVPSQSPISDKGEKSYFGIGWTQWFVQVKAKIDVINSSLVGLASVSGTGLTVKTTAGWLTRNLAGTTGRISIANGDGIAGNPTVDLADSPVTPGSYTNTNLTVDRYGRITAAADGSSGGAGAFTGLSDVPNSYAGAGGYYVQVKLTEDGLQFTAGTGTSVAWGSITGTLSDQTDLQTALNGAASLKLVGSTVLAAAATSISVSGLSLNADKNYIVKAILKNASASTNNISLSYNADSTSTNYEAQRLSVSGSGVASARSNDGLITAVNAGGGLVGSFEILRDVDSFPRAFGTLNKDTMSALSYYAFSHYWNSTVDLTDVVITGNQANGFAAGSTLKVYRVTDN